MTTEALAARLLAAFLEDLDEQLRTLNADLLMLEATPTAAEPLTRVFRAAHTLKGAARATGISYVEPACHVLEDLLTAARDGRRTLGSDDFAALFFAADALADAGKRLRQGTSLDGAPITQVEERVRQAAMEVLPPDAPRPVHFETPRPDAIHQDALPVAPAPAPFGTPHANDSPLAGTIRVHADKIDTLMTAGSQLVVSRSRLRSRAQQTDVLHDFVTRWAAEWRKTGPAARKLLERHAAFGDIAPVFDTIDGNLRRLLHDVEVVVAGVAADAEAFGDMIGRLFERVQDVRVRPFADACTSLARAVRDVSTAAGKEAAVAIVGGDIEADRAVLDVLRDALLHLVRNAVDHGIELPAERARLGKPTIGMVMVTASLRGDRLVVTVSDDGTGVDVDAVRAATAGRGLPVPSADADVLRALFISGVSTRSGVTTISGRGVGLDAVEAAVHRVGGTVHITSERGRGTTFTLECPLTLATIRALLVSTSAQTFAIPTAYVAQLRRAGPDEIKRAEGRDVLLTDGAPVPVVSLGRLLGPPFVEKAVAGAVPVVVLRATEGDLALVVDQLLTEDEIVVHPVDRVGESIPVLGGAAVLGTGEVAFVLNVAAAIPHALGMTGARMVATGVAPSRKRVLVVDDSITTRTLEQSTLEAAGYDVTTAVDGGDAWRLLRDQPFDLIVSDVEMPRMDGVALCEAVRAARRLQHIPIVLVTALENPAQRMRGLDAGANAYIGKSAFDQVALVDTIRQLIG